MGTVAANGNGSGNGNSIGISISIGRSQWGNPCVLICHYDHLS